MDLTVTFDGDSAAGYLISEERTEKLCIPGQEWEVRLDFDCPLNIRPWDRTIIREDGEKVLTGYAASVSKVWAPEPATVVTGFDTWKRAMDGWVDAEYVTGEGDTVQSLLRRFLDMAGLSYQINTAYDADVPAGLTITYQPYSEVILDLCASLNLFVRVNEDGWVIIGDVVNDGGSGPDIGSGDVVTFDMVTGDYRARNKVIVWGPLSKAIVRSDEDWAVVDHTMVYASPYAENAWGLANAIWSNVHTLERVKTLETPGDPDRRVGQRVDITAPDGLFDGEDICTTIKARTEKQGGYRMQSIFGERCAIFGAGPNPVDGRDVIVATHECGVWRCRDIWASPIHWEQMNIGIESEYLDAELDDWGSGFDCEWFIRDPFQPNQVAYLLTKAGILKTISLEPGYENWQPAYMNWSIEPSGSTFHVEAPHYIIKIRSTIARQGAYFVVVQTNDGDGPRMYVGLTNNGFLTMNWGPDYCTYPPPTCTIVRHSGLWGPCNYGYQKYVAVPSWHRIGGYTGAGGGGGLAAWHRNDWGCTISGVQSSIVSSGGPAYWNCRRAKGLVPAACGDGDDAIISPHVDYVTAKPYQCFGPPYHPLDPPACAARPIPTGEFDYNAAASWQKISAPHIPYNQRYSLEPAVIWWTPGKWSGTASVTTGAWPTRNGTPVILPWSPDPNECHLCQGSLGTLTYDRTKVAAWSYGKPSRFAYSNDEGLSWTETDSVPVKTGCFSGFPTSENKVYAGRDPVRDPTGLSDTALIYVSWDRGATWHDVTGDLWTQTRDLGKRTITGQPAGSAGLVTIAPRYV